MQPASSPATYLVTKAHAAHPRLVTDGDIFNRRQRTSQTTLTSSRPTLTRPNDHCRTPHPSLFLRLIERASGAPISATTAKWSPARWPTAILPRTAFARRCGPSLTAPNTSRTSWPRGSACLSFQIGPGEGAPTLLSDVGPSREMSPRGPSEWCGNVRPFVLCWCKHGLPCRASAGRLRRQSL